MMANEERKLAASSSLIPLEIDPASILSLSKGVIFDTIVHNVEYTLNNRRTDPLPWKLIGMSLICDPSRNKKYMHKLQKMQCVPSVICTQIYHSKLIKTESGVLTTPGRKIVITTPTRTRLTGIIVCRSIDELLFMESSNTDTVHFIQYKLLSYERIATRELVNGPKLSSAGDKIIKTVFDFELTQNNGFPRQLLPVAIISFGRQEGCDLCLSIRNFLKLDEHQTFDKSYLVTSINVELDRLREEQERKEDAEIEQELAAEKIQRRQPLADLSRKSTDTGNARSAPPPLPQSLLRVAPIKIKLPRTEKPVKLTIPVPSIDSKFRCLLKLDRIDLSLYPISNLPISPPIKSHESITSTTNSLNLKTKSLIITKPYEHHKSLKRLNHSETKKTSSLPPEIFKEKRNYNSISIRSSTSDATISLPKTKTNGTSTSTPAMSPIYRPKPTVQKRIAETIVTKKKIKRPVLPTEYHCSLKLTQIDLSMYDIDLPPIDTSVNTLPMEIESTVTLSPSTSTSSEQQTEPMNVSIEPENIPDAIQPIFMMEQENIPELEEKNIFDAQQSVDTNTPQHFPHIVDEFPTPDLNGPVSSTNDEVLPLSPTEALSQTTNEPLPAVTNEVPAISINKTVPEIVSEIINEAINEVEPTANDQVQFEAMNDGEPTTNDQVQSEATNDVEPTANDQVQSEATNEVEPTTNDQVQSEATNEVEPTTNDQVQSEVTNEVEPTTNDQVQSEATNEVEPTADDQAQSEATNEVEPTVNEQVLSEATNKVEPAIPDEENTEPTSSSSPYDAFSPDLPPLDDDPVLFSIENSQIPTTDPLNEIPQDYIIIVPCSDDEDDLDDDLINTTTTTKDTDIKTVESSSSPIKTNTSPVLMNPSLTRILGNTCRIKSHRLSTSSSSSCSSISISILHNQSPRSPLHLTEMLIPPKVLNKKQHKLSQPIIFNRYDLSIPSITHEPLIDPRLIYRLQSITTDLRWPSPCNQCSISPYLPSLFTSSTQTILYDRKCPSDFVDPRRESLKHAILNTIYQRIKILIPNIFIINSNQFQKLLFEQTTFKTNCSLHLEYLLHKIKLTNDMNFFHMMKTNDEFQLSPFLLQLIFN